MPGAYQLHNHAVGLNTISLAAIAYHHNTNSDSRKTNHKHPDTLKGVSPKNEK